MQRARIGVRSIAEAVMSELDRVRVLGRWVAAFALLSACGDDGSSTTGSGGASTATTTTTSSAGGGATTGAGGQATGTGGAGGGCGDCQGFDCCPSGCANLQNDIHHCGTCGNDCTVGLPDGAEPYCDHGTCGTPPCDGSTTCNVAGQFCCGTSCCNAGELCCSVPGPIGENLGCVAPTEQGTCPTGCVLCRCVSEGTLIATPEGPRTIESLQPGDLVYTEVDETVTPVPIAFVSKKPVHDHTMVHAELANGAELVMSAEHPLGDGRALGEVRVGDTIDGVVVRRVTIEPYRGAFTYDLLPARGTGRYVASGVFVGSTLR